MTTHTELHIRKHFETNSELTVDLVDSEGNSTQETFYNEYEAITDISNLECEFDVYL